MADMSVREAVSAIGPRVRKLRQERGFSLQELGRRSGLSAAAIHKIEGNSMTPTITTLLKLATALNKSVGFFVDEGDSPRPVEVIRREDRRTVFTFKEGLTLASISGRYAPFFLAGAEATVEPHASSGPEPMQHPGEELVLVTKGTLEFTIEGETIRLRRGDSIHFRTNRPHGWRNPRSMPAGAVWLAVRSS
jgi:transcriptional regulator with XRE-family HTH domain